VGTAEFGTVDELLAQGQRAQFTSRAGANASSQLADGYKVTVKALLTSEERDPRLNLLSVHSLADRCR
jgi:hypothetical protein